MAKVQRRSAIRIVIASSITVVLMLLAFSGLLAANSPQPPDQKVQEPARPPVQADQATPTPVVAEEPPPPSDVIFQLPTIERSGPPPPPAWVLEGTWYRASDYTDFAVTKSVETGQPNNDFVFNGEYITYTITLNNSGASELTNITVWDTLPRDKLEEIECLYDAPCTHVTEEVTIKDPLGVDTVVTVTRYLSWNIASLPPFTTISRSFRGRVVGQADNTTFNNFAEVQFYVAGVRDQVNSNSAQTTVRVDIAQLGQASVSTAPTWFSSDLGGTLNQDWGDFDQDGDLDLALATATGGAYVYLNNNGSLVERWINDVLTVDNQKLTYGVRWADFDNDGILELVTVGSSADGTAATGGTTYIYQSNPQATTKQQRFVEIDTFDADYQMVRVEPGDFNGDGFIDLVVSTNSINAPCPVRLYLNTQTPPDMFTDSFQCVSDEASANMKPADFDNDGDLDLVLGLFEAQNVVLARNLGVGSAFPISVTNSSFPIDTSMLFLPYDFAWGDYNKDGYLDLAAGYPLQREVRVYQNVAASGGRGFSDALKFRTTLFRTPLALDWGDFDGDGSLELAVADSPPQIREYRLNSSTNRYEFLETAMIVPDNVVKSGHQLWSLRAVDFDGDGDMDLSITDRDGPSMMLTGFISPLSTQATTIDAVGRSTASSVAWGDADGDGDFDLLFGAAATEQTAFGSALYYNENAQFSTSTVDRYSGFGPHSVAFGNLDNDATGELDVAIGTSGQTQVYRGGEFFSGWNSSYSAESRSVAWGDANDDGLLDLLVGNNGANVVYLNQSSYTLPASPSWISSEQDNTRSVAWGDFNGDGYLDFAVGNSATSANRQSVQVYQNNLDGTFSLIWNYADSTLVVDTRSVAWADYDGDGDLDLAVGNYNTSNWIFENYHITTLNPVPPTGLFSAKPMWASDEVRKTTSLAWGDWDNDGDLDLAVGNDGQPDQVYGNLGSKSGSPRLEWVWTSTRSYSTTGVAWGDVDGDGDLDLAYSQGSQSGQNGYYLNSYVSPSHLVTQYASTMPLPNNPSYVTLGRPGTTDSAYLYSAPEVLSGERTPVITVTYKVFDPDGSRNVSTLDATGNKLVKTFYEYSLDGGGTWKTASPSATSAQPLTQTSRLGQPGVFLWNAQQDQAISDNARFRVRVVHETRVGPVQRASTSAVSPPFRVRGLTCTWPRDPAISYVGIAPSPSDEDQTVRTFQFSGSVLAGSGVLTFTWTFGDDSSPVRGQSVEHTYETDGTYNVTLSVVGQPCPETREIRATTTISVGTGINPTNPVSTTLYLPVMSGGTGVMNTSASPGSHGSASRLTAPSVVTGLYAGKSGDESTILYWGSNHVAESIFGYRIYRRSQEGQKPAELITTLPATVTRYQLPATSCGQIYYITAFNARGESPQGASAYFSSPCESR